MVDVAGELLRRNNDVLPGLYAEVAQDSGHAVADGWHYGYAFGAGVDDLAESGAGRLRRLEEISAADAGGKVFGADPLQAGPLGLAGDGAHVGGIEIVRVFWQREFSFAA